MPSVAVIGAGVVGLSAACIIQDQQPGAQVTIIADKFTNDTTSHGAAGLFRPSRELIGGDPELITWVNNSCSPRNLLDLSRGPAKQE